MSGPRSGARGAAGFVSVQYVAAGAAALLVFVVAANLLVQAFTVAVVRDALDAGVRAGTVAGAGPQACAARAREVADGLLARSVTGGLRVRCDGNDRLVVARARVRLRSWLPGVPIARRVTLDAFAAGER